MFNINTLGGSESHNLKPTNRSEPLFKALRRFHFSTIHRLPFTTLAPQTSNFPISPKSLNAILSNRFKDPFFGESLVYDQFLQYIKNSSTSKEQKVISLISFVHSVALRLVIIKNISHAIILEDDAQLDRSFVPILSRLWSTRPLNGMMFQLNPMLPRHDKCDNRLENPHWTTGIELSTAGYIVSNLGAQFIFPHLVHAIQTGIPVDWTYKNVMSRNGDGYHVRIQPDIDYDSREDVRQMQKFRYIVRECGLVMQRPIKSLRESMV